MDDEQLHKRQSNIIERLFSRTAYPDLHPLCLADPGIASAVDWIIKLQDALKEANAYVHSEWCADEPPNCECLLSNPDSDYGLVPATED